MGTFFMAILSAMFINNFVVVKFLGICPFLGVSRKTDSALGMGVAVTLVMTITALVTYPLYTYVLVPLKIEYLEIIFFIFVIASLVQMLEKIIEKFSPPLYQSMGIYLPLITTNCAVLGVAELVIDKAQMMSMLGINSMNIGYACLYAFLSGLGFTLAIVVMSGLREKIDHLDLPSWLKGFPISMIAASFMAMGFFVFGLIA